MTRFINKNIPNDTTGSITYSPGEVSWGERIDAISDDMFYLNGRMDAKSNTYRKVWDPIINEIKQKTNQNFENPGAAFDLNLDTSFEGMQAPNFDEFTMLPQFNDQVQVNKQETYSKKVLEIQDFIANNREAFDEGSDVLNIDETYVYGKVREFVNQIQDRSEYVSQRTEGYADMAVNLAGGVHGSFTDPANLVAVGASASITAMSGAGILSSILIDTIAGTGAEWVIQKDIQKWYADLGLEYTEEQFRQNIIAAAATSATLGGAAEVAFRLPGMTKTQIAKGIELFERFNAQKAGLEYKPNKDVESILQNDEVQATLNAKNVIQDDVGNIEHNVNINKAAEAIINNKYDDLPKTAPERLKDFDALIHDKAFNKTETFDPDELNIDAKRFQFKTGGDEFGMLDTLKGVEKWEPLKSNIALVFEDTNGKLFIADGHQRVNLAKRLKKQGQKPSIVAYRVKEADGFTPQLTRAIAARKNIAEGSADPFDAARALQIDPNALQNLPPQSAMARYANGLSQLDQSIFRLAENSDVPSSYSAMIGQYITGAQEQLSVLKLLERTKPSNMIQAESIIQQAKMAGFEKVKASQAGLFGDDDILENVFKERADILDATIKLINNERRVFGTLVENSNFIEKYGNKLDKLGNAERRALNAEIIETIKTNANTAGAISGNLTTVAKEYARKDITLSDAARRFSENVTAGFRTGEFTRLPASPARITDDIEEVVGEFNQSSQIRQEGLEKYDDVNQIVDDIDGIEQNTQGLFDDLAEVDERIKTEKIFESPQGDGSTITKTFDEMLEDNKRDKDIIDELRNC